jgi:hypothetical protein
MVSGSHYLVPEEVLTSHIQVVWASEITFRSSAKP